MSSNASWSALVLSGDGHELVITSNGIICVSTNLGLTFMPTTGIGSVFATSSNGLSILSVSGANLYVSTNRGATWTTNTTPATFVQFAASSDARVIAASDGRLGVYVSTNFAQSWNSNVLSDPISGGYYISRSTTYSLACSADGSHIYGAATTSVELNSYGWIFGSTNFGATWNVYDQSGGFVLSVACSSGGTIVFYSQYGYAGGQVSTNSGTSWSGYGVQGQGNIACSADGKVAVLNTVSTGYGIGVSPNMGTTWYAANCPIQQGDVMSSADGNTLVASSYGAIYISKPPPNLPVSFASSFTSSNGVPTFVVAGQPGYSYMVETSSDLINWTTIASLINTNGTVPFTDPAGMNYTQRFYRVVVGP
ncbi:MAG TPA: hypothetical protein VH595_14195 [Verrucomicrobiae bacterium]|nr:hypothetical protein [Verrucomicrobiae bacterium]